ncbi:hypothetical protein IG3_01940 [Bacillus cereus HuA2-1]|uniref:Uncharacterized protein n=1 Tax=Bacillus cereus HuA2-1 TaxID=1053201 RepID=J9CKB3_BACCE|nr:hypothetical protein IG3_01940 [Bacillus cereus HuA2-1]
MKKILKVILILLVIFIGIMLGSIILNKTYHTEFKSLDNTDQNMLKELSTIYKSFEESSDKLWIEMYRLLMLLVVQYEKNVEESYGVKNSYC